jgi:3-deoxy-7-phosphoheptulonate synthase
MLITMSVNPKPPPSSTSPLPRLGALEDDEHESTTMQAAAPVQEGSRRPFLIVLRGKSVGELHALEHHNEILIGRGSEADLHIDEKSVSRLHAKVCRLEDSHFAIEDLHSANGTRLNGKRIARSMLEDGDQIAIGVNTVLKFEYQDELEESAQRHLFNASTGSHRLPPEETASRRRPWSPDSWTKKTAAQSVTYEDRRGLAAVVDRLRRLPPLVTSWEVEELKRLLAEAQEGKRFLLQGGDCAETFRECNPEIITNKLKILLQMSLVLIHGAHRPVIRVGRFAGQYAKPRSRPTETRGGVELRSYLGDLVNRPEFTAEARQPDPHLLIAGHQHAAMTLNFIRSLSGGAFPDLRRPEYYDLSFFDRAQHPTGLGVEYHQMSDQIAEALHFVTALGRGAFDELARAFFTSHEGLNLVYEAAQTRRVPRRDGYYDLSAHFPWIGERTRALDGAHVEFFRGISNPVGVKLGPAATPEGVVELCKALNPDNEAGKLVFIVRMGAAHVSAKLPWLIEAVQRGRHRVLWVSDPMHGNMIVTGGGVKTRNFDDILKEVVLSIDVHEACGSYFGGVHFELTGEDVTECIGGGLTEADLDKRYLTACDPRLNYRQAVEMAFCIAQRMSAFRRPKSTLPPKPMVP